MNTVPFSLETSELVTVERMGIGVPVLLVLADITQSKCYFVCLNDYIDKILIPRYANYRAADHRTVHVPLANEVGDPVVGLTALRWYGKRAKLLAGFQRIIFQSTELDYAWETPRAQEMAQYFASRLAEYDFWTDTEMWRVIAHYGAAIRRYLDSGDPGLMRYDMDVIRQFAEDDEEQAAETMESLKSQEVRELWRLLAVLPRNYEDVCREWFLPTALGYLSSYPS